MKQAISAGHQTVLDVAKEILHANGNAFDAAIAAHLAMFIAEPCMASAGGNGFALTKSAEGKVKFVDFFCQTPKNKPTLNPLDFYPVEVDFGGDIEVFHVGLGSAAVPGSIAGLFALHRLNGSMPFKELVAPAIELAKVGVPLSDFQAYDFRLLHPIIEKDESVKDVFFKDGKIKQGGDLIQMPQMADFLDFISTEGERGFYQGDIAKKIAKDSKHNGGFLRRKDFENYKANILDPLVIDYRGKHIYLPNGPSKGGVMLAMTLAQLDDSIGSIPTAIRNTQSIIQNEDEIENQFKRFFPHNNFKFQPGNTNYRGTSHFNILDKWGNAVSLTSTIGEGSGYFIPDTSMHLNNMMGEIFLLPKGAHSWIPDTRMHSMMTPTMITNQEQILELISGSGGANRIPYSIAQVIHNLYHKGKGLEESTSSGRVHYQDGKYQVEKGFDCKSYNDNVIYWENQSLYFGGVHSIYNNENIIEAIGDLRRDGVAEVF
jgi:gamma-glutamyltranspeptidase/glutathione hydrolase